MESQFIIQVVHKTTGQVVQWAPGLKVEKELIAELANRVAEKGVGVFRTTAHVKADLIQAFEEMLLDLKRQV